MSSLTDALNRRWVDEDSASRQSTAQADQGTAGGDRHDQVRPDYRAALASWLAPSDDEGGQN